MRPIPSRRSLLSRSRPAWTSFVGASRFDYQSVDVGRNRLFIAHLGADQVTVFDLKNQRVITDIVGVAGAHGVTVAPDLGRVFAAATGTHQVAVIEADSLQIIGR